MMGYDHSLLVLRQLLTQQTFPEVQFVDLHFVIIADILLNKK
jgi:hypothetical protein